MEYLAAWLAESWWYPVGIAAVALGVSARMHWVVRRALSLPGGRTQPYGFAEVLAVVVPVPTALPLLYAPVLYGWTAGPPVVLGSVGTGVAWGLVAVAAVGMLAAGTRTSTRTRTTHSPD
ncbi:hypothetical protein [Streptomyces erythrochromogenes]|uniref:hypothetical protein n=1 Tax=Streptomyces erythrochromogenes TaxID=285574 RepID=UPI00381E144A|nr:hypothetical protein OG489_03830 [Streptomyces erythrochromogenes]